MWPINIFIYRNLLLYIYLSDIYYTLYNADAFLAHPWHICTQLILLITEYYLKKKYFQTVRVPCKTVEIFYPICWIINWYLRFFFLQKLTMRKISIINFTFDKPSITWMQNLCCMIIIARFIRTLQNKKKRLKKLLKILFVSFNI